MQKGWCVYTISDKEFFVDDKNKMDGKTWWELRPSMIQLPPESWVKIKSFIIETCKKTGQCNQDISSWERKTNTIDSKLGGK